jgi:hypothetical protein
VPFSQPAVQLFRTSCHVLTLPDEIPICVDSDMTIQCFSCSILDMFLFVLLMGRCRRCIKCIELLTDVTPILNFENQTDVGVLLILSILKACFYI